MIPGTLRYRFAPVALLLALALLATSCAAEVTGARPKFVYDPAAPAEPARSS